METKATNYGIGTDNTDVKQNNFPKTCPHCGYCPTCGRLRTNFPYPVPYYSPPYWIGDPTFPDNKTWY